MSLTPFALSAALLFAGAPPKWSGGVKHVSLGREFQLRVGQWARLRDGRLKVRFASVGEDSRCPEKVSCVWAGNAKISVVVQSWGGKQTTAELNTNLEPRASSTANYEVALRNLSPYPRANAEIRRKDYVATLVIRQK